MKVKSLLFTFEDVYPLVGKFIIVSHLHGIEDTVGKLFAVDPESLALVVAVENGMRLVIKNSVLIVEEIDESRKSKISETELESIENSFDYLKSETIKSDFCSNEVELTQSEIACNKQRVLEALKNARLAFQEDTDSGIITVLNCVQIQSPYLSSACFSANENILNKIKNLLATLEK